MFCKSPAYAPVSVTLLKGKANTLVCESPAYAPGYTCITCRTDFCNLVPSSHKDLKDAYVNIFSIAINSVKFAKIPGNCCMSA